MKFVAFFNLIRWKNLLLIALMQILIEFYFLNGFDFQTLLSDSSFYLLVFPTITITASGYIINDIIDLKIDAINKPSKVIVGNKISILNAKKCYILLTSIGILAGIYVSFKIGKPFLSLLFIGVSSLLFIYSKFLKGKVLIGNIIVSLLLAFSILILLIFDIPIEMNSKQWDIYLKIKFTIVIYAVFAFLLNFTREIIKDIEDVDGDYSECLKTLPIVFGRKVARNFAIFISVISIYLLIFTTASLIEIKTIGFLYIFVFVFSPLLYFIVRLWNAKTKKQYSFLSNLLKIIILFGILSIPIISNLLKNAFN
ncbi:MAG: prenyltransferase [Lutibacter sp.]|nr:MAG: prenyltransferase [Lutibacter sp.]